MEKLTEVLVVIPTYNREHKLKRCLNSLINQTYKSFKVVVIDDGSTDNTFHVVGYYKNFLNLTYLKIENSGGPARPRNIGASSQDAKYVAFLDSDDWWSSTKLECSIVELEKGYDFVYHDLIISPTKHRFFFKKRIKTKSIITNGVEQLLEYGNCITTSSVVMRQDLFIESNGFDEDKKLVAVEDYDLWVRVAKLTHKFKRLDIPLGCYSVDGEHLFGPSRYIENLHRLTEKYFPEKEFQDFPGWIKFGFMNAYYRINNKEIYNYYFKLLRFKKLSTTQIARVIIWRLLNYVG
jgi:glycosyltransferase involved in cell wall biosynthesis